jgi:hypothetical protein
VRNYLNITTLANQNQSWGGGACGDKYTSSLQIYRFKINIGQLLKK